MADTQPPAPTDAELDELRQANSGRLNFVTFSEFRTIARAVLAKWGTQPVACEPLTDSQPQAGAVPLTDEQIEAATGAKIGTPLFLAAKGFVLATEAAHGIKGGQHGADI